MSELKAQTLAKRNEGLKRRLVDTGRLKPRLNRCELVGELQRKRRLSPEVVADGAQYGCMEPVSRLELHQAGCVRWRY